MVTKINVMMNHMGSQTEKRIKFKKIIFNSSGFSLFLPELRSHYIFRYVHVKAR